MKKIFLFLLIVALGVASNVALATNSQSSWNAKISWRTVFLSSDKSVISVIKISEEKRMEKMKNYAIIYTTTRYDTIANYQVQKDAQEYISDSIAYIILDGETVHILPDSVLPRWTHIFGKDTVIKRNIKVNNGQVCLFIKNESASPKNVNILWIAIIITLILLIINLVFAADNMLESWFVLFIAIGVIIILVLIKDNITITWFDFIFLSSSFVLGTIISIIIKKRKKKSRNFNKQ